MITKKLNRTDNLKNFSHDFYLSTDEIIESLLRAYCRSNNNRLKRDEKYNKSWLVRLGIKKKREISIGELEHLTIWNDYGKKGYYEEVWDEYSHSNTIRGGIPGSGQNLKPSRDYLVSKGILTSSAALAATYAGDTTSYSSDDDYDIAVSDYNDGIEDLNACADNDWDPFESGSIASFGDDGICSDSFYD